MPQGMLRTAFSQGGAKEKERYRGVGQRDSKEENDGICEKEKMRSKWDKKEQKGQE